MAKKDFRNGFCDVRCATTLKQIILLLYAISTGGTCFSACASGALLDRSKLSLTFAEDFVGAPEFWDAHKAKGRWKTCYWFGWQPSGKGCVNLSSRTIGGNGSLEVMTDATFGLNGVRQFIHQRGSLAIVATPIPNADQHNYGAKQYVSGMITTQPSFSQLYGYFEMRAELPQGAGLWPAFWMLPVSTHVPLELDVMEYLGRDPKTIFCSAHWGNGTSISLPVSLDGTARQRSYGVLWMHNKISWYVDDIEVARMDNKDINEPMYLIASMSVGGRWGGNPNHDTIFPAKMIITSIKAYKIREP